MDGCRWFAGLVICTGGWPPFSSECIRLTRRFLRGDEGARSARNWRLPHKNTRYDTNSPAVASDRVVWDLVQGENEDGGWRGWRMKGGGWRGQDGE